MQFQMIHPCRTYLQLNFKKGAEIILTQKEDGGWWEGTLDGKTGWFPSNYVKEIVVKQPQQKEQQQQAAAVAPAESKRADYRQQVVKDLLLKEKEFVSDLRNFHKTYIGPLHRAEM